MAEYKKLKYYFDKKLAVILADKIHKQFSSFNDKDFVHKVSSKIDNLELKARVEVFTDFLHYFLPEDYKDAAAILLKILGPENKNETGMFTEGFWLIPVAFFVEKYGVDDFEISVNVIYEITKRHTGEYAVRPFIERYFDKMLNVMKKWSIDESFHVRRLSSEGVRPRLPWAKKLQCFIDNPEPIFPILENLKEDESKFVQKSVANCLNDIIKDNYDTAMNILEKWSITSNKNTAWIIKHALRNEIKKNNQDALKLLS